VREKKKTINLTTRSAGQQPVLLYGRETVRRRCKSGVGNSEVGVEENIKKTPRKRMKTLFKRSVLKPKAGGGQMGGTGQG